MRIGHQTFIALDSEKQTTQHVVLSASVFHAIKAAMTSHWAETFVKEQGG